MKIKIPKATQWKFFPQAILLFLLCEKFYNHTYVAGKYNVVVTLLFFTTSLLFLATGKVKLKQKDFIPVAVIVVIVLYGFSRESIRYGLVFFSLLIWNKIHIDNLEVLHKSLVIVAVILSGIDYYLGYERISGFSAGSPTLFSCALAICFLYFLFKTERTKSDYLFSILCLIMVLKTKSSSVFLFMIALIAYKVAINILYKLGWNLQFTKIFILLSILVVVVFLALNLNSALGIINRGNRIASTSTRLGIYQTFLGLWFESPKTILLGYGGGFSQKYIQQYWGTISHMPLHQDILMLACEYGVIGIGAIYRFLIKEYHLNFLMSLALVLTTFHNVILSPMTFLLLILTSNALNEQYGKIGILWR